MTMADFTLLAFTTANGIRVVAYVPQIWKAATDTGGARAISFLTWALFLASHLATALYALVNRDDWMMAAIFLVNGAGCVTVLALTGWRRAADRRAVAASTNPVAVAA